LLRAPALPDTTRFKEYKYKPTFRADYISQTDIGYTPNYMGSSGFAGGTTIVFSDLLGNHQIAASANVNGRIQDASAFVAYTNMSRRLQYATGAYRQPLILPVDNGVLTEMLDEPGHRDIVQGLRELAADHQQHRAEKAGPDGDRIGCGHPQGLGFVDGALVERQRCRVGGHVNHIADAAKQHEQQGRDCRRHVPAGHRPWTEPIVAHFKASPRSGGA